MAKFVLIAITAFLAILNPLASSLVLHDEHDSKVKFGYIGPTGPNRWSNLSPSFSKCAKGKSQSPVNILTRNNATVDTDYKPLLIHYTNSVNATLINYGFNVGIRFGAEAGVIVLDGKNYTLQQMHWHVPSEHRIDREQFAAELQLVHFAVDDHTPAVVIAVLFELSHVPDRTLIKIRKHLSKLANESSSSKQEQPIIQIEELNIQQIKNYLKKCHKYYKYNGSLTTPPCTEQVTWAVLHKRRIISKHQIEELTAPLEATCKNNSRPVQHLYERKVQRYHHHHYPHN